MTHVLDGIQRRLDAKFPLYPISEVLDLLEIARKAEELLTAIRADDPGLKDGTLIYALRTWAHDETYFIAGDDQRDRVVYNALIDLSRALGWIPHEN